MGLKKHYLLDIELNGVSNPEKVPEILKNVKISCGKFSIFSQTENSQEKTVDILVDIAPADSSEPIEENEEVAKHILRLKGADALEKA